MTEIEGILHIMTDFDHDDLVLSHYRSDLRPT
jgi:hypothetical protein